MDQRKMEQEAQLHGATFVEVQRFNSPFIWVLVLVATVPTAGLFLYGIYEQIIRGHPWGDRPMSDLELLIVAPLMILFLLSMGALFYSLLLRVEVREDAVYVRYAPLHFSYRVFPFDTIASCRARQYKPMREYGGWGVRGTKKNAAYNVSGDWGVQLEFKDGRKLLIGSQRAEELAQAIQDGMARGA